MERLPPALASALSSMTVTLINSTAATTVKILTTRFFIVLSLVILFFRPGYFIFRQCRSLCVWCFFSTRFAILVVQLDRRSTAHAQIEHLHQHRESHREIDVSFGYVHVKAVADKGHADQEQKAECQHLDGRVFFHEGAYFSREQHHEA